ncbi:MAG: hypothetical protein ACJ75F_08195 [Flavisolibacter sp.]|jgi:hypothetical protein
MQINVRLMSVITLALFTTFTACKKEPITNDSSEMTTHSEDQSIVSNDMDDIANDVNVALETSSSFSGRESKINGVCNATAVIDSVSNPRTITINYEGANCFGTNSRTGTIILSMPAATRWKDAGAALTVTYQNLKITRLIDNKSITLNGVLTFTNVSGGLMINLPNMTNIIHTITSSNLSIKFADSTVRTWQIARKRTFTYDNGIVVSISGIHTDGNNTQIAEWGTNRFGHPFTTSITQPLIFRQACEFRLTGGQVKHQGFGTATATFGLNASGLPTSCPGSGHYYYSLEWTGIGGNTHNVLLPY